MSESTQKPMPDHNTWPAFTMPWDDNSSRPTDMSHLLDKPAGAKGFIQVVDGHLATGDGKRWRIWGQNFTFGATLPPTHMTATIARRLAKFGINCIRLHHMDRHWPRGVLKRSPYDEEDRTRRSTRALDPEAMARLDYLIACCKEQGIYIDLNLNVSRQFSKADGVKQAEWIGYGKGLTYFDPTLIKLQKEYAAQLLNHVNPFTGAHYAEEPAIAIIEMANENSLLASWVTGRLRGEQQESTGTWGDIPSSYAEDLDKRWNDWLAGKYDNRETLSTAWDGDLEDYEDPRQGSVRRLVPEDFEAASDQRFQDEASFYAEIEQEFYRDMASYLRGKLGAKQLLLGTSDHNHRWSALPLIENNTLLDIIDGHVYWQHPRFPNEPWSDTDWYIENSPMLDDPDGSAPAQLARTRVSGKPYIVSELNAPFPNDYAAEFIPVVAAYGALQDWDGLFWFAYGGGSSEEDWTHGSIKSYFSMANDPVKMTETAIGALMFLRGDVRVAERMIERRMPHDWVLESLRTEMPDDKHPFWFPQLPGRLALIHGTTIDSFDAKELSPRESVPLPEQTIVSDTEELTWESETGNSRVLVDTVRHQAIVGYANSPSTANMSVELDTPFAAVELASLDERPIAKAERLLLVTVSRVANTDMKWVSDERRSLSDQWGHAPTRVEPVTGKLNLKRLQEATSVMIQPLDDCGQLMGKPRKAAKRDGDFSVELDEDIARPWYLITISR